MATQYQIEQVVGITDEAIAKHIMARKTSAAKSAYTLLKLQCAHVYGGIEMLKAAVADCRREMATV